jgi:hypothetical protein
MIVKIGIKDKRRRLVRLAVATVAFLGGFAWAANAHGAEISGPLTIEGVPCGKITLVLGPDGHNEYRVDGCAPLTGVIIGHTPLGIDVTHAVTARDSGGNYALILNVTNSSSGEVFIEAEADPRFAAVLCRSNPATGVCFSTPSDKAGATISPGQTETFSGFGSSPTPTEIAIILTDPSNGRSKVVALEIP